MEHMVFTEEILAYQVLQVFHFHSYSTIFLYVAMLSASVYLILPVIEHYDKRSAERSYKQYIQISERVGWCFFLIACAIEMYLHIMKVTK